MGQTIGSQLSRAKKAPAKAVRSVRDCYRRKTRKWKNFPWDDCSDQELEARKKEFDKHRFGADQELAIRKKEVDRKRSGGRKISTSKYGAPVTQPEQEP